MTNPVQPEVYFLDPAVRLIRVTNSNGETQIDGLEVRPTPEKEDYAEVNFILTHATGWGRDLQVTVQAPAETDVTSNHQVGHLFGVFTADNQNFGYKSPLAQSAGPDFCEMGDVVATSLAPNVVEFTARAIAGTDDMLTRDLSTSPLVRVLSGARNVMAVMLRMRIQVKDMRALMGRALPLNVTINGALMAEVNARLYGLDGFIPRTSEAAAPLDNLEASADLLNGCLLQHMALFQCDGPGLPVGLELFYSSENSLFYRDAARETKPENYVSAPFGHGWGWTYGARVLAKVPEFLELATGKLSHYVRLVQDPWGRPHLFWRAAPTSDLFYPRSGKGSWSAWFDVPETELVLTDTGAGFTLGSDPRSDVWRFDAEGRLVEMRTREYGRPVTLAYGPAEIVITDSSLRETRLMMQGERVDSVRDPAGNRWRFVYDGPSLIAIESPIGRIASFAYDRDRFLMTSKTNARGRTTAYEYVFGDESNERRLWGSLRRAVTQDSHRGLVQHAFAYRNDTANPQQQFTVDHFGPRGFKTTYDVVSGAQTNILTVTRPDGGRGEFEFDDRWQLFAATDPLGVRIAASAPGRDAWPDTINVAGAGSLRFDRPNPDDRRFMAAYDPRGDGERYEYADIGGAFDRITKYTQDDPFQGVSPQEVRYTWTGAGDLAEVRESQGEITRFEYGGGQGYGGLRTRMIRCVGTQQLQEKVVRFSPFGQISGYSTDGFDAEFDFDGLGRQIKETRTAEGQTTERTLTLDLLNNVLRSEESDGSSVVRTLDGDGFVVSETVTEADGSVSQTTYKLNPAGNPEEISTADGGVIRAEYTPTDQLGKVHLPDGSLVEIAYNLRGDVIDETRTDPSGAVMQTTNEVDERGRVQKILLPEVETPDGLGARWRPSVEFEYFPNDRERRIRQETAPGEFAIMEYELDGSGRPYLVRRMTPDGHYESMQPLDAFGLPMSSRGPTFVRLNPTIPKDADVIPGEARSNPYRRDYHYDCRDRLVLIEDGGGNPVAAFDYDSTDQLTQVRAPDPGAGGAMTPVQTRDYDADGRLERLEEAGSGSTTIRYEMAAQEIDRPGAGTERHEFDPMGRPTVVQRTAAGLPGLVSEYRYTARGDLAEIEHANVGVSGQISPQVTRMTYDMRGRIISKTDPLARAATMAYDGFSNLSEITAPDGRVVQYDYDALGRIAKKVFIPSGQAARYAYDGRGNLTFAENEVCTCRWRYDGSGRVLFRETTFKAANVTKTLQYQYDPQGPLAARTDSDGVKQRYRYDNDDRLIELFLNDETNPIIRQDFGPSGALDHRYLVRGGFVSAYSYERGGALRSVSHRNALNTVAAFDYTRAGDGRVVTRLRAGEIETTASLGYDSFGRLKTQTMADETGAPLVEDTYLYDSIGNILGAERKGCSEVGAHDAANQLLRWDAAHISTVPAGSLTLGTDSEEPAHPVSSAVDGNRLDRMDEAWLSNDADVEHVLELILATPTAINRIELQLPTTLGPADDLVLQARTTGGGAWTPVVPLTVQGGSTSGNGFSTTQGTVRLSFSAITAHAVRLVRPPGAGFTQAAAADRNRLAVIHIELQTVQGTSTSFRYDAAGSREGAGAAIYRHDPEGRLVAASGPGFEMEFSYGPDGRLALTTNVTAGTMTLHLWDGVQPYADYDGSGQPLRTFITAPGHIVPFGFLEGAAPSAPLYFYLTDERHSVVHLVRDTNLVVNTYEYEAWGEPLVIDETVPQPLRFMGQRYDAASGLYLWRARTYDPATRRFLEKDPIAGSPNPYSFLDNDPATISDPLGLKGGWLETLIETAKELPGVLYEDFSSGAAASRLRSFGAGFGEGVKAAVTGTVHAIAHPVETVTGVVNAVVNYDKVWEHLKGQAEHLVWQAQNDPDGFGESMGRLVGEIEAGLVIGAGTEKLKAMAKVGDMVAAIQRRVRILRNSTRVPQLHPSPGAIRGPELQLELFGNPPPGVARLPGALPPLPKHPRLPAHLQFKGRIKLSRGQFRKSAADQLTGVVRDVFDRRHLVADYSTKRILSFIANHCDDPIRMFEEMSSKRGYTFNAFNNNVGKVARKLQLNIFNDLRNVKVGPAAPNRMLGRRMGAEIRRTGHANINGPNVIDKF